MVDITHSLLDDQELRAHFAPAMSSRHKPWFITLTRGGELVNSAEPLEHRPTVLLGDDDLQPLHDALIALDIDYMPSSTADGAEHRTLTYRVGSQIRHIMLVGGVSSDFLDDLSSTPCGNCWTSWLKRLLENEADGRTTWFLRKAAASSSEHCLVCHVVRFDDVFWFATPRTPPLWQRGYLLVN